MWLKWLPWRYIVRRVARAHDFLDPVSILSHLHRFAQPSEVAEPIELLRAGVVFHARGLMNTRAIQHNLDWIWPYWVERQFEPKDCSFIPRAFSITHVNLTHRNWTAVGLPDYEEMPIVDPRGLVTPFMDSWSLDGWIVTEDGRSLIPSRLPSVSQRLCFDKGVAVITESSFDGLSLASQVEVRLESQTPVCRLCINARAESKAWAVISLRPYNPEGVSFIHDVGFQSDRKAWIINGKRFVEFNVPPDRHRLSDYRSGDVHIGLASPGTQDAVRCEVGMATAAALFELKPDEPREIVVRVPLTGDKKLRRSLLFVSGSAGWEEALRGHCELRVPDERFQFLYDAALRTIILHSPADVFSGPYTYKRFWFRDAAFILNAMLCVGLTDRAERALNRFPARQTRSGYFHSQEGEWDSNGEALWIMHRFCELKGCQPKREWLQAIHRGGRWIKHKRLSDGLNAPHAGLFPAGFSAEHLGPNDYYYWDNFWGIAGLRAAADMIESLGKRQVAEDFRQEADALMNAVKRSLELTASRRFRAGIPASPYRRMDAGAIGSLAVGYPLQLWPSHDPRLLDTAEFLMEKCFVNGGFFQDMIHSGINAYLTLHVAQVLLRAGDPRFFDLVRAVAECASATGQWPEAIHPHTGGGCMGDGQHAWASAEWILIMRNCFVREEGNRLILASGIPVCWLQQGKSLSLGPTPTPYGVISVSIQPGPEKVLVTWQAAWRGGREPILEVRLPGYQPVTARQGETAIEIKRA